MENDLIYLDEVINQYLSQYRLPDSAYSRIAQIAIRGRRELHLHSCGKSITVPLEVQADKTIKIPCDCLNVLSIKVVGENGDIPLEENEDLSIPNSYSINHANNTISLPVEFSYNEGLLTYLPQATQDGDYIVHPLFYEALIQWIVWQDSRGDRKTGDGTKRENERIFYNALRVARRAVKPFDLNQVYKSYSRILTNSLSTYKWT